MHIGLIGGIGVAGTIAYYQRLTMFVENRGGHLDLTIVHADIHELIRNNLADDRETQADIFARLIDRLRGAGCDCAALTSLGAHYCFEETRARTSLPLVSGVAPLDDYLADHLVRRAGLLGTRSVMRTRLFGQLKRTEAVVLDDEIEALGKTYQDIAVRGMCLEHERRQLVHAGMLMSRFHDADVIVLAGTDLNLAFDGEDPGYQVIDALDVHVDLLARLATGAASLDTVA